LQEVAGVPGLGPVAFEPETEGEHFVRLWTVGPAKQKLFTVDLTRIGGSVLLREIVKEKIEEEGKTVLISAASRDYLLLQKAESFVPRRVVKARDAFDIRLLLLRGAKLDSVLKGHLEDCTEVARSEQGIDPRADRKSEPEIVPGGVETGPTRRGLHGTRAGRL
jgi:hypothetical protein